MCRVRLRAPTKLVTGNERLTDDGGADAAVLIVVQVAPAYPNRRDVDEGLVGPAVTQIDRRDPDIPRSVEDDRLVHERFTLPGSPAGPIQGN